MPPPRPNTQVRSPDSRKSESDKTGGLEHAYDLLRPVLFAVLRRLARQGYLMNAAQGLDFVHDFFLEAWPGIANRYDPSRGSLTAYAAAAFARFVRPRLVMEARWRAVLSDDDVASLTSADADVAVGVDVDRVRAAMNELDASDRTVLLARFRSPKVSERTLAREAGMTRYKFRECVSIALTRLAVALGERGVLSESDFQAARLLLVEGRSVAATAAELSLTEPQVRSARRRIIKTLAKASLEG